MQTSKIPDSSTWGPANSEGTAIQQAGWRGRNIQVCGSEPAPMTLKFFRDHCIGAVEKETQIRLGVVGNPRHKRPNERNGDLSKRAGSRPAASETAATCAYEGSPHPPVTGRANSGYPMKPFSCESPTVLLMSTSFCTKVFSFVSITTPWTEASHDMPRRKAAGADWVVTCGQRKELSTAGIRFRWHRTSKQQGLQAARFTVLLHLGHGPSSSSCFVNAPAIHAWKNPRVWWMRGVLG